MTNEPLLDTAAVKIEKDDHESQLAGAAGKLALASIGAVSLAEETAENVLRRLVARGDAEWQNVQDCLARLRAKRPHLRRPQPAVLTLGPEELASKADIRALELRLDTLSAQLEAMNKSGSEGL